MIGRCPECGNELRELDDPPGCDNPWCPAWRFASEFDGAFPPDDPPYLG